MREAVPPVAEQVPAAPGGMDLLVNQARRASAVIMASLSLGAGFAAESLIGPSLAEAHTSHARPEQVKEFVRVIATDASGKALPKMPENTFVFLERCEDGSRPVSRKVTYDGASQPLGSCDIGSPVTVTEKQPVQGSWTHGSGTVEKITKATRRNNHRFIFKEREQAGPVGPSNPTTGAAPSGGSGASPAPNPMPPTQPAPGGGESGGKYPTGDVGVDISWAQCGTADEAPSGAAFGIVDVNDGLGYSTNPCLSDEAADFPGTDLSLYVNTGWNSSSAHINPNSPRTCTAGDEDCLAYNYGYNAGLYAYDAASAEGITGAGWWLDVESNATWATETSQNENSLQGEHDALIASGVTTVGAYSTTAQWDSITGSWENGWPSWGATTWTTAADAETYCTGHEFTGGPSYFMQYTPSGEIDHDVAC